jgi:uncharacterized protein
MLRPSEDIARYRAANRKTGVLRVDAVHEDEPFSKATAAAVDHEIAELTRWLQHEHATAGL